MPSLSLFASFIMEEHFSISRRGLIYFILLNGVVFAANILFKNCILLFMLDQKLSTKVSVITTSSKDRKVFAQIEKAQTFAGQIIGSYSSGWSFFYKICFDVVLEKDMIEVRNPVSSGWGFYQSTLVTSILGRFDFSDLSIWELMSIISMP